MGIFNVCLIASDGTCSNSHCETVNVQAPVGADEELESGLTLYPNPAKDLVIVEFNLTDSRSLNLEVQDLTGKVLHSEVINTSIAGKQNLNLESISSGIYLVKVVSDKGGSWIRKLMLTK